tara:strand:+ start:11484 stop:13841 length:2358 start_codon:yes stop_codon:yes gene_type:complete
MARDETRTRSPTLLLRGESGRYLSAVDVAEKIENFVATPEGTLRSVQGPCRLMPHRNTFTRLINVNTGESSSVWEVKDYGDYGPMHGIHHCLLMNGTRDVLLVHTKAQIRVFRGYRASDPWSVLVGPKGSGAEYEYPLTNDTRPQFPTQFESTSQGVLIVPQNYQRAFFYDGEKVLPLGYDRPPSPPIPNGPKSENGGEGTDETKINNKGFAVSRMPAGYTMNWRYGYGRIGTIAPSIDIDEGNYLLDGKWQYAVQWIDAFGNMSPVSNRSNSVKVDRQLAPDTSSGLHGSDRLKKWFNVSGIASGRKGTVGRILYRTRDIENSGTMKLFQVPGNVGFGTFGLFATLPDNRTTSFVDNNADGFLVLEEEDLLSVPNFQLCRVAFGRMFIGNLREEPGAIMYSLPNKFGTFPRVGKMYPDPSGGEITGLWAGSKGLLVFTQSSMFLVMPNDSGEGFKTQPLNQSVGCVAPSSLANLPDNSTMWLGREGFYRGSSDGSVSLVSTPIDRTINKINWGYAKGACAIYDSHSKEYRCWVPINGNTENNLCLIFDGENWRTRRTEKAVAACVTKDERKLGLIAGVAPQREFRALGSRGSSVYLDLEADSAPTTERGVFVLDHANDDFAGDENINHVIETGWIDYQRSDKRKTTKSIYLGLRERFLNAAKITVYRDYREEPAVYIDEENAHTFKDEDRPAFWTYSQGSTDTATHPGTLGAIGSEPVDPNYRDFDGNRRPQRVVKPRPYWKKIDVEVGSCETYKIRIETPWPVEFIGLIIEEEPKVSVSARTT